ncbi:LytTR family DNA-binding domain-containing protein [Halanaerocella petrolearia]
MSKIRTVIAEDEFPARNELNFLLSEIKDIRLIGQAADGLQALELVKTQEPDLILLDIQMPGKTGMEVAQEIKGMNNKPVVIFITAYDEYALEAFGVEAVDYILKPYDKDRLLETIKRVKEAYFDRHYEVIEDKLKDKSWQVNKIPVCGKRGRIKLLDYNDIIIFFTKNSKVYTKTYDQEYQVDLNLKELESKLNNTSFLRIHRSYLINLKQVKEVIPWFKGKYQVVMDDQQEMKVPVSRSKVEVIKYIFNL